MWVVKNVDIELKLIGAAIFVGVSRFSVQIERMNDMDCDSPCTNAPCQTKSNFMIYWQQCENPFSTFTSTSHSHWFSHISIFDQ